MLRRSRVAPAMRHLLWFTQPTATLLDLAGVAYVVDAASTGYTPSLYWSQPAGLWRFEPCSWSDLMESSRSVFRAMRYMTMMDSKAQDREMSTHDYMVLDCQIFK